MKINWNPSKRVGSIAKKIYELKQEGYSYSQLAKIFDLHRTYIIALKHVGEKMAKGEYGN